MQTNDKNFSSVKILTIDLEDWFHILAHDETASPLKWERFESRVERNTEWILEQLDSRNQPATFFCLGWIAKRYPNLIRKIAALEHEIACHGMNHQLVYQQRPADFREDLKQSIFLLEDLTGQKVTTYRAPGFSVTPGNAWVFELLAEAGILNDCSVFPAARNHGGLPEFGERRPCKISVSGFSLREFPMAVTSFFGKQLPVTGGGYFRLAPYALIHNFLSRSDYVMTYFHPRDFDASQPVLKSLPRKRRWMSYTGLKSAGQKFKSMLRDFQFLSVAGAVDKIDWNETSVVAMK